MPPQMSASTAYAFRNPVSAPVTVAHRIHNGSRDDSPVSQVVKLKLCSTAKMPVNFAMVKRNCKPHRNASCSALVVQRDDIIQELL